MNGLNTVRSSPIWTEILPWVVVALCGSIALYLVLAAVRARRRTKP